MSMTDITGGAASRSLAEAVWPGAAGAESRANRMIRFAVLAVAGALVLTLAAKISVPWYPVPMTMQTLAIMAMAAAYGMRLGVATVVLYLAAGFSGLPVFAYGAAAGPAYFLGTTGGFLIGFIPLAAIVGLAADHGWSRSIPKLFAAMVFADAVMFALGFVWLAWFAHLASGATGGIGVEAAYRYGVTDYVLADFLKIGIAALGVPATWTLLRRRGERPGQE